MRRALRSQSRFIVANRLGKRILFAWCSPPTLPNDQVIAIATESDFDMGVLLSGVHQAWLQREGSTLRVDFRYTPTSTFETFPWPSGSDEIAEAARRVIVRRSEICLERQTG